MEEIRRSEDVAANEGETGEPGETGETGETDCCCPLGSLEIIFWGVDNDRLDFEELGRATLGKAE